MTFVTGWPDEVERLTSLNELQPMGFVNAASCAWPAAFLPDTHVATGHSEESRYKAIRITPVHKECEVAQASIAIADFGDREQSFRMIVNDV